MYSLVSSIDKSDVTQSNSVTDICNIINTKLHNIFNAPLLLKTNRKNVHVHFQRMYVIEKKNVMSKKVL